MSKGCRQEGGGGMSGMGSIGQLNAWCELGGRGRGLVGLRPSCTPLHRSYCSSLSMAGLAYINSSPPVSAESGLRPIHSSHVQERDNIL